MPSVTKIQRPWIKKATNQSEKKTDKFYHSSPWRKSTKYHRAKNPLCYYCELSGTTRIGTLTDHFRPRKIFPDLALEPTNFRTSCDPCHNVKRQWEKDITTAEQFETRIKELLERFIKHKHNTA
jgi:5-methylcytosine-specific restriction endonuclease McrA